MLWIPVAWLGSKSCKTWQCKKTLVGCCKDTAAGFHVGGYERVFHCTLLLPCKDWERELFLFCIESGSGLIQSVGGHTLLLQELLYYHRSTTKVTLSQCNLCTDFKVFCIGASDEVSVLLQVLSKSMGFMRGRISHRFLIFLMNKKCVSIKVAECKPWGFMVWGS